MADIAASGNVSRREFLSILAAASAILPLAACGGSAAPAASTAAPSSPASAASVSGAPASAPVSASAAASKPAASASAPASTSVAASSSSSAAASASGKKDLIKIGLLSSASDAGIYIGIEKGWFSDLGIDFQTSPFANAAQMVAPLSAGQLDAGGGATSAGLNNALARDIGIKMVADKGSVPADSSYQGILIRKDLWDSGRVKDYKDLKGLKFALSGEAISPQVAVSRALEKGGLTPKDIDLTFLAFPDMAAAFGGKSIDAAHPIEPFTTQIPDKGLATIFHRSNEYSPNDQIAVVLFGPAFVKDRSDVAKRFMLGYI
ncbi:MAG: ABC transporter substrate-binding protein, partial [Chloroflexi bacterium]|nr:ABC transporter substrate-binding protein [Chloroflexota bacterium]